MHAGFQPDHVADGARHLRIQADDEIHGALFRARNICQKGAEQRPRRFGGAVDHQIGFDVGGIVERPLLRAVFHEEIKRIIHRHVGNQINLDPQFHDWFGKHEPCQPVAIGILLMVHEMPGGADLQAVRQHAGAAVRSRAQADHLWPQRYRAVVCVVGQVVDAGKDRHGHPLVFVDEPVVSQIAIPRHRIVPHGEMVKHLPKKQAVSAAMPPFRLAKGQGLVAPKSASLPQSCHDLSVSST